MIFIDRREPPELNTAVRKLGVETSYPYDLEYGDLAFEGNGECGPGAMIALERKKLSDLITSMQKRRLSGHQARGLHKEYDYVFLIAEGMWRAGSGGEIEHWGSNWTSSRGSDGKMRRTPGKSGWIPFYAHATNHAVSYTQLASYMYSMTLRSKSARREPLRIIRTSTLAETAAQVVALYKNFTEKLWEDHHAHDQIYTPLPETDYGSDGRDGKSGQRRTSFLEGLPDTDIGQPSVTWAMAAQLPGVDRKARLVADHFKTPMDMVLAGLDAELRKMVDIWYAEHPGAAEKAWEQVRVAADGKKTKSGKRRAGIGRAGAKVIVRAIFEGKTE